MPANGPGGIHPAQEPGMPYFLSRRQFVQSALLSLWGGCTAGCGTVLHPERRGQPAGPLDWSIVALDAIGLLFFFIPGVIAFAVDFSNGTIYLPTEAARTGGQDRQARRLISIPLPERQATPAAIERALAQQTGCTLRLTPGEYQTEELDSLDRFWEAHDRLASA
jgi:hypothetical protein